MEFRKMGRHGIAIATSALLLSSAAMVVPQAVSRAQGSGGVLTIGFPAEPKHLDPGTVSEAIEVQIDRNIFDTLLWQTPNGSLTPDLATKWKTSNGGRTYTFWLRTGVKFQDGTPFNAQAVVENFERDENPATKSEAAISALGPFKSVKALGPYEVQINFKSPYAPFLAYVAQPQLGIESPTAIKKYGTNIATHPVGTGPFEVVQWIRGVKLILKRNPDYNWAPPAEHRNGPAKLSEIVYDWIPSDQARLDAFQAGEVQLIDSATPIYFKTFASNPQYREMRVLVTGAGTFLNMEYTTAPTNSLAVRQAILYAINRNGVIQLADDGEYPAVGGPVEQGAPGYDAAASNMYPYNPNKAEAILAKAGWKKVKGVWTKDGRPLKITMIAISGFEDWTQIVEAVQNYLSRVGIQSKIEAEAQTAWGQALTTGKYNLSPNLFSGVDPDFLRLLYEPGQVYNYTNFSDPRVTTLLNKGLEDTNPKTRMALYDKAEEYIMQDAAVVPLRANDDLVIMDKNLKGVSVYTGGEMDFYNASLGS